MLILARSKKSLSSTEAKEFAKEMEILDGTKYKDNLNYLRLIEMLMVQRIAEQVCDFKEDTQVYDMATSVELPLIGEIKIIPRVFHEYHGMTNKPSYHFDFEFIPSSPFKADVVRAYTTKDSEIPEYFSSMYGEALKNLYDTLRKRGI